MTTPLTDRVKWLQGAIFLVWIGAFGWMLGSRQYMTFLRPDFWVLLAAGLVLLFGYCAVVVWRPAGSPARRLDAARWVRAGILVLPVVYALVAQGRTLDSYSLMKRNVSPSLATMIAGGKKQAAAAAATPAPAPEADETASGGDDMTDWSGDVWGDDDYDESDSEDDDDSAELTPEQLAAQQAAEAALPAAEELARRAGDATDLTIAQILEKVGDYTGKNINTMGIVYRVEGVPDGHFLLFRFQIICCVADAQPLWIMVRHPEAGTIDSDIWVNVTGPLATQDVEGELVPTIEAASLTRVKTPRDPYLY